MGEALRSILLWVDGDPDFLQRIRHHYGQTFFLAARGRAAALAAVAGRRVDVLVTSERLPDGDGATLIREVRERSPHTACVLLTEPAPGSLRPARSLPEAAATISRLAAADIGWLVDSLALRAALRAPPYQARRASTPPTDSLELARGPRPSR